MRNKLNSIFLQITGEAPLQNTQKFNIVIGVIAIIFIGIVAYLIRLDRKINKLENK